MVPFGQFHRNLSNKSENLVLADAWGNVIDEVYYYDSDPWPWEADGEGAYLELIDLDLDNSLPESWTVGYDLTAGLADQSAEAFRVYPNPTDGWITIVGRDGDYRISNMLGQLLMSGAVFGEYHQLDVSRLPAGLYFITLGDVTQKFVVR